ncbi:MAG: family 43 glycosylhydrolase, partial [Prolixibacteraceae bacterium]|nr:family 43 glycosylhydrolase [Prolixibacteraceae bacterium]
VNWYNYKLDIDLPEGLTNCWAPDVVEGFDGKYYYYMGNCQFGCNIYGYVSDNPIGPWTPLKNGEAVIPVGTSKEHLPALDAQFFMDEDSSLYSYFGTWCTSFGGIGCVEISTKDYSSIIKNSFIPIAQVPKAFEASYMLKRNNKYFLMYSSGDCRLNTYAVHYSVSDNPFGPFNPGENCPILSSNDDGIIDSPGHHAVLKDNDEYYLIYHRHDNPHSSGGMFRQICADKMTFTDDKTIEKVYATNEGVGLLKHDQFLPDNIAKGCMLKASSFYHLRANPNSFNKKGIDYKYSPENATDDNNGTLWKAANSSFPQSLEVDLGKVAKIKRILTQFEYSVFYYRYLIEVSEDGVNWILFSDKSDNRRCGSPMIDDNEVQARFVRLKILGTEKPGLFAAVWNIKIYDTLFKVPELTNKEEKEIKVIQSSGNCLVELNVKNIKENTIFNRLRNKGSLKGYFRKTGSPIIKSVEGVKAVYFDGKSNLMLTRRAPESLAWNSPFTVSTWVYNPEIESGECIIVWNSREDMLMGSYAALMYGTGNYGAVAHGDGYLDLAYSKVPEKGKWHHIAVSFDGMLENVYVDGVLDTQLPVNLFVENDEILIGASGEPSENFSGYISNLRLYDKAMNLEEILRIMKETK